MDQSLFHEGGDGGDEDPNNHPILRELKQRNNYNPAEVDLYPEQARFFVIKSYSEDDIHRSIKYEIWCSTDHGNKRLDQAFRERQALPNGSVYLFFSVNGSGHFCGTARMMSPVDYDSTSSVWAQDKWKGQFKVRWIYVKDVPNGQLRHITLENNENKPVTNSRDTQEVLLERGKQVLAVMHQYKHSTSIFDDFLHYEKKQEAEVTKRQPNNFHHKGKRGGHHQGSGQGHPQNQHHQQSQHNQQNQQSQYNPHQQSQRHQQNQHNQYNQKGQQSQHHQQNQRAQHNQRPQQNQQYHSSFGEDLYRSNSGHVMPSSAKINHY